MKPFTFPELIGSWSFERYGQLPYGRKITFTPKTPLPENTKIMLYLANITGPLQKEYGSEYLYEFITQPQEKIYAKETFSNIKFPPTPTPTIPDLIHLDVPYYSQAEAFTCNIAAARAILSYRGILKTEAELKSEIPEAGTRGDGNPHQGYTHNYGTYWEPVAKMITKYRPHQVFEHWNLTDLLKEVANGNPVMTWGQNGWSDPHELTWTNPDGTKIYAVNGMHSVVVTGFTGTPDHPTQISINDPWRGQYTITPEEFSRRWNYFNVALVVY